LLGRRGDVCRLVNGALSDQVRLLLPSPFASRLLDVETFARGPEPVPGSSLPSSPGMP
jgi:hypothetical protein